MSHVSRKPAKRLGRPTAAESKKLDEKLKSVAYQLFLNNGFDAVTMEAIAEAAGITKRTLYAKYSDKGELFAMVLRSYREKWTFNPSIDIAENTGLEEQLCAAAEAVLTQTLNRETVKIARMAAAKAEQFPREVQQDFIMTQDPRVETITTILKNNADAIEQKYLDNIVNTGELFISMIVGIPARLASFGTFRGTDFERARLELAVELFAAGIRKRQ